MRKMKPSGKGSLLRGLLRALGIDRETASVLPMHSHAETQSGVSMSYTSHPLVQNAWKEVDQAKAKAMMELQRKQIL